MRIGMLTGGGDCPGLNAVIRAAVRKGIQHHGDEFVGFMEGWRGVLDDVTMPLDLVTTSGILQKGGTILRSSRTNVKKIPSGFDKCVEVLAKHKLDALIALGGDDTQSISLALVEHFETVRRTKSGQLLDVSLTVSPIRDKYGRVIGASKILRDVSARKRIEQALLQAEKIAATGRMAATIAHEINNPLEAVMNLMYLLRPMVADPEGIAYFDSVETELGRVAHIAKQTLGYYREHAAARRAAMGEIVRHAVTIYEPRCTATGIEIKQAIHSSKTVVLRRGEMTQVISNLIMNSIYAMPGGGVLSISVEDAAEPEDGVVLTVQDNGDGIAEADLPRVFEAFFTTRSTVGTGIGLFVAKQFVEGHGGRIEVESRQGGDDQGTTVRVLLPASTTYDSGDELVGKNPRLDRDGTSAGIERASSARTGQGD